MVKNLIQDYGNAWERRIVGEVRHKKRQNRVAAYIPFNMRPVDEEKEVTSL